MLANWPRPALLQNPHLGEQEPQTLLTLFQKGSTLEKQEAFSAIYNCYAHSLWEYISCSIPESESDAKDIFCQVWLVAMENLPNFEWGRAQTSKAPLRAWLFECARRRIQEYYRRKKERPNVSIELLQDILALEMERDIPILSPHVALITRLKQSITKLKVPHQKLLELRYRYNESFKEIGEVLGKNEGAARKQHHYILCKLRKELEAAL